MNDKRKPRILPRYKAENFDDEILLYDESGTKAVYLNEAAYTI